MEDPISPVTESVSRNFPVPVEQVSPTGSGYFDSQIPQGPLDKGEIFLFGKDGTGLNEGEVEISPVMVHCPTP